MNGKKYFLLLLSFATSLTLSMLSGANADIVNGPTLINEFLDDTDPTKSISQKHGRENIIGDIKFVNSEIYSDQNVDMTNFLIGPISDEGTRSLCVELFTLDGSYRGEWEVELNDGLDTITTEELRTGYQVNLAGMKTKHLWTKAYLSDSCARNAKEGDYVATAMGISADKNKPDLLTFGFLTTYDFVTARLYKIVSRESDNKYERAKDGQELDCEKSFKIAFTCKIALNQLVDELFELEISVEDGNFTIEKVVHVPASETLNAANNQ